MTTHSTHLKIWSNVLLSCDILCSIQNQRFKHLAFCTPRRHHTCLYCSASNLKAPVWSASVWMLSGHTVIIVNGALCIAAVQAMLASRQEGPYLRLLPQLTAEFSDISRSIIKLESKLTTELGRSDLAAMIRRVQEGEREKLRTTLALQALKKAHRFQTFSWQDNDPALPDWTDDGTPHCFNVYIFLQMETNWFSDTLILYMSFPGVINIKNLQADLTDASAKHILSVHTYSSGVILKASPDRICLVPFPQFSSCLDFRLHTCPHLCFRKALYFLCQRNAPLDWKRGGQWQDFKITSSVYWTLWF